LHPASVAVNTILFVGKGAGGGRGVVVKLYLSKSIVLRISRVREGAVCRRRSATERNQSDGPLVTLKSANVNKLGCGCGRIIFEQDHRTVNVHGAFVRIGNQISSTCVPGESEQSGVPRAIARVHKILEHT